MSLIFKWLESLSIDVTITERCSREVSPKSTCTTCMDHCPVEALSIENNRVRHDLDKCDSCGGCITACPVGAINGTVPNRTVKNGMLCYEPHYCPTVKELLIFRKRGIKGISVPSYWQDLEWKKAISEANEILLSLNMQPFFFQKAEEMKEPEMTRRQLLVTAKHKGQSLAKDLAPASWKQNSNAWSLPFYYPDVQFFEASLDREKCSLCKGCFILCPQGVFSVTDAELVIDHQKCPNCRLCEDACPEGAISISENVGESSLSRFSIVEGKCKRCKQTYLSFADDEGGLCHVCTKIPSDWLMP
ncbi:4Fe-4S binding protein [Neobacillus sp. LXY-4]|uniref:DUF362 domain-containing protein n=1 Tax=Neobacillus sp. LXY-4 TaxID=3379826 RepID=UPI003EE13DEC